MTLKEYQDEYDRLFKWRERWTRLANKHTPGRLQTQQEFIERRAWVANNKIHALMLAFDQERQRPYVEAIQKLLEKGPLYRQDIFNALQTPGRTNAGLVAEAIGTTEAWCISATEWAMFSP